MPISAMGQQNSNSVQVAQKAALSASDTTTQTSPTETQSSPAIVISVSEATSTRETAASPLRGEPPKEVDEAAEISASRAQAERVREAYLRAALISRIGGASGVQTAVSSLGGEIAERTANAYHSSKDPASVAQAITRVSLTA